METESIGNIVEEPSASVSGTPLKSQDGCGMIVFLFWERRRWLGCVAAIGLFIATVIAFLIPKQYESKVEIMPPDPQTLSSSSMMASMAGVGALSGGGGLASSLLSTKNTGATFIGILGSRTVQDDLINRFDLRRVYGTKRYFEARKKLAKRTSIQEDRKSGIISITVTDNDPYRARDLAGAYVQELDRLVSQLSTSSARRERVFLEERLRIVKEDLDNATLAMSQFSSRNATLDVQSQGKAMIDAVARIQGELIAAQSELRGLGSIYAESNVRVRSARARIAELQRQLQKMGGTGESVDASELKGDQVYPSIRKLPMLGVTYYDLYRRAKIQESVYETLTKQYELSKVQEAREIPTVKLLDVADLPEKKSFPPRLEIMILGMLLSLVAGMAWIGGMAAWNQLEDSHPVKWWGREIARASSIYGAKNA